MLSVEKVSKVYPMGRRKLRVLHQVDLEVDEGEFLSIVGPSGAGKSTLLHIMGLLDTPTEGRIIYDGQDLSKLGGRRQAYLRNKLFGFVFQFYHLLPDFNTLENVSLPGLAAVPPGKWHSRKKEVFERGRRILGLVGLGERTEHRPSQLSGGERQRAAIARALINKPEVLLCDEPTGNLDTHTGARILDMLESVQEETGCTVVIVTHDPSLGKRARRRIRLVDGRIDGSGAAAQEAPER